MRILSPTTAQELCEAVATAAATGRHLEIRGGGSKAELGAHRDAALLDLRGFCGVVDYDPAELTLTVRPGTPLAQVEALIATENQALAFEPWDHGPVFGRSAGAATIGGVIAAGVAGPARLSRGSARDHLLGIKAVSGRAEAFVAGAKVVKNVTGYDLPKLLTGSWGRLAAMTELTLKVGPRAPASATMVLTGLDTAQAVAAMSSALSGPLELSAAAHVPAALLDGRALTLLRVQGFERSVQARCARLPVLLREFGFWQQLGPEEADDLWQAIRSAKLLGQQDSLWRIHVAPSCASALIETLEPLGARWFCDWAGGLVWLALGGHSVRVRDAAETAGGHAILVRATAEVRNTVPALHPRSAAVMALEARIRRAFDPAGVFETTRFLDRGMQTQFSVQQLEDTATAAAEAVIRKCVHCGFCLATCPTYVLLGDELDSPRGRIYLIKDLLENERTPTATEVKHIDRCLSCLACMSTCPSGVHYMHLVDHARAYIERRFLRPLSERLTRALLAFVLPHPERLRRALSVSRPLRPAMPLLGRIAALRPLVTLLRLTPARAAARAIAVPARARRVRRGRVAVLHGCVEPVLRPEIRAATARVLNRSGYDVTFVAGEGCCGALVHHLGREHEALKAARSNVDAWGRELDSQGLDAIVVSTSGCGTMIKDYGYLLRADAAYAARAARISALARDVTEVLTDGALPSGNGRGLTVAYHGACSLQHGQQLATLPQRLLETAGYTVRTPLEPHMCCGSAGTYNVLQPQLAGQLGERKAAHLARTRADVIATGNIGCMVQIGQRSAIPVVHTIELLDWATGGPVPPALAHLPAAKA